MLIARISGFLWKRHSNNGRDLMLAARISETHFFFAKGWYNICYQLDVIHSSSDFLVNIQKYKNENKRKQ